ncbi:hypothetical protein [Desulfocurvibacter africanus]|nr:hypothetical protein [Desulfocurvibacter africanus]
MAAPAWPTSQARLPMIFVRLGEEVEVLRLFNDKDYAQALLGS